MVEQIPEYVSIAFRLLVRLIPGHTCLCCGKAIAAVSIAFRLLVRLIHFRSRVGSPPEMRRCLNCLSAFGSVDTLAHSESGACCAVVSQLPFGFWFG